MAKLSIVIPVYNAENWIAECLDSVTGQGIDEYEIVIVNDGSSDSSRAVCEKYINEHPNASISLINQENGGVSTARNRGIKEAKGEWISFLDADDHYLEGALGYMSDLLERADCDVLAANYTMVGEAVLSSDELCDISSTDMMKQLLCLNRYKKDIKDIYYSDFMNNSVCWAKFYKRQYLLENRIDFPVGIPLGEDKAFLMKLYLSNPNCRIINRSVYFYTADNVSACRCERRDRAEVEEKLLVHMKTLIDDKFELKREFATYVTKSLIHIYRLEMSWAKPSKRIGKFFELNRHFREEGYGEYVKKSYMRKIFYGKKELVQSIGYLLLLRIFV